MARKPLRVPVPVKLIQEYTIGEAVSAAEALSIIGDNWDRSDGEVAELRGHYEFEMDSHRFLVHVTPIEPLPFPTPFDDDREA